MKLQHISNETVIIEFSKNDLGLIDNALNEVCNGIEVKDFDRKMGVTIDDARKILRDLTSFYREIK